MTGSGSHGERHTSISGRNAQGNTRVDDSAASPQVRKSHASDSKSRAPLPRDVTFSALPLGRAERDPERGEVIQTPTASATAEPEPVGPLAAKYLDQLAARQADADPDLPARQAEVLTRLRRTLAPKEKP